MVREQEGTAHDGHPIGRKSAAPRSPNPGAAAKLLLPKNIATTTPGTSPAPVRVPGRADGQAAPGARTLLRWPSSIRSGTADRAEAAIASLRDTLRPEPVAPGVGSK